MLTVGMGMFGYAPPPRNKLMSEPIYEIVRVRYFTPSHGAYEKQPVQVLPLGTANKTYGSAMAVLDVKQISLPELLTGILQALESLGIEIVITRPIPAEPARLEFKKKDLKE